jgi:DNA topoisomerase-1
MAKTLNLVVVESSTKAKIIEKYLNTSAELKDYGTFVVMASQGHIRDISKENMGINLDSFKCDFVTIPEKKKIVSELKKKITQASTVYLAADNDREGEGIAWHIKEHFKINPKKYKRILFNEITQKALVKAVQNPLDIDQNMVNSYMARRILDRLVGFMITKLLWKSFNSNVALSAGRVQSATLNILIHKEKNIKVFTSTPTWTVKGNFGTLLTDSTLYKDGTIFKLESNEDVKKMLEDTLQIKDSFYLKKASVDTESKKLVDLAPLPFTTSTLQQRAYNELGISIKQTMKIAQELYELGAITYMRTDSTTINAEMSGKIQNYIEKEFGKEYVLSEKDKKCSKTKIQKHAQEAHEAIRPTSLTKDLTKDRKPTYEQVKLYDLIFKRTFAFFMKPTLYHEATVEVECNNLPNCKFVGKNKVIFFEGWRAIYGEKRSLIVGDALIEQYKEIQQIIPITIIGKCNWNSPPSRFNEASLVQHLEKLGIGRPSTYASIINKLLDKHYVEKTSTKGIERACTNHILEFNTTSTTMKTEKIVTMIGAENNKMVPQEVGEIIDKFVSVNFPNVTDATFTSNMEDALDNIAKGDLDYLNYLEGFFKDDFIKAYACVLKNIQTTDTKLSKQKLGQRDLIIEDPRIDEILGYKSLTVVCLTKYDEAIKITDIQKDTTKYINLKVYMNIVGKKMEEILAEDVLTLLSFPLTVSYKNIEYDILYGRHSFYMKETKSGQKYTIYKQQTHLLFKKKYKELLIAMKIVN